MKKTTVLFICLLIAAANTNVKAQVADISLTKQIDKYLQFSNDMQVDSILNCIYPRIFEIAPKAQIRKSFMDAFTDKEIKIQFEELTVKNIEPTRKFSMGIFTKFIYTGKMLLRFYKVQDSVTLAQTKLMYQQKFGEDKVVIKNDGTFEITTEETVLAIKDNYSKKKWTFLSIKEEQQAIMKKIIPLEIRKAYKF